MLDIDKIFGVVEDINIEEEYPGEIENDHFDEENDSFRFAKIRTPLRNNNINQDMVCAVIDSPQDISSYDLLIESEGDKEDREKNYREIRLSMTEYRRIREARIQILIEKHKHQIPQRRKKKRKKKVCRK